MRSTSPHLLAALAALALIGLVLCGGAIYAQQIETGALSGVAPLTIEQKSLGVALQERALSSPDILLLYGSSELRANGIQVAGEFFQSYPTGFMVFPTGLHGANTLIYLQNLSSLGGELRGKKIALSISPGFFLLPQLPPDAYAFNFSHLHAYDLALSTDLSPALKRDAARRMVNYPSTYQQDLVLGFLLERLADGSPPSMVAYWALYPLGKLQSVVLRLQDHWATVDQIRTLSKKLTPKARQPSVPDWPALKLAAEQAYAPLATNNPFGIADVYWTISGESWLKQKDSLPDPVFLKRLHNSREWTDLELMLRALSELGAEPVLLSMPIHGTYYDYMGVSAQARNSYYDRLEQLGAKYRVSVFDFRGHDLDKYFMVDFGGHLSAKGWIYYDEVLDTFYHSTAR